MNDKKTITVGIPVLDNVDQMKVVETFTEEQLWYVCAIAKAFEKKQSNWNSLRELIEKEKTRLAKECSHTYEDSLGKTKLVNEDIFNELNKISNRMNELEGKDKE